MTIRQIKQTFMVLLIAAPLLIAGQSAQMFSVPGELVITQSGPYTLATITGQSAVSISPGESGVVLITGYWPALFGDPSTGVRDLKPIRSLSIYPNPTADQITLRYEGDEWSPMRLSLYLTTGQVILFKDWETPQDLELNLAQLPSGMYLLHVSKEDSGETGFFPVVKQ